MEYCPEIAILHGTFACIQAEVKAGKYSLIHHVKGDNASRPYILLREAVREVISGVDSARGELQRKAWSRRVHHLLFCKAFVFTSKSRDGEKGAGNPHSLVMGYRACCLPIPDFHPHIFFQLAHEFDWADCLGEMLAVSDLATALTFTSHSLAFCDLEPALMYDLHLLSATLDLLMSMALGQVTQALGSGSGSEVSCADGQSVSGSERGGVVGGGCQSWFPPTPSLSMGEWEELAEACLQSAADRERRTAGAEDVGSSGDQARDAGSEDTRAQGVEAGCETLVGKLLQRLDHTSQYGLTEVVEVLRQTLDQLSQRLTTRLFDRSTASKASLTAVLPLLGHLLGLGLVSWSLSSITPGPRAAVHALHWLWREEEEELPEHASTDPHGLKLTPPSQVDTGDRGAGTSTQSQTHTGTTQNPPVAELSSHDIDSVSERRVPVSLAAFLTLLATPKTRKACAECVQSFFVVAQTAKAGGSVVMSGSSSKLSLEKAGKFIRVLKLKLQLCGLQRPLQVTKFLQSLRASGLEQGEGEEGEAGTEVEKCLSFIMAGLQKRERAAEEKRRNPSLAEVTDALDKQLPRWQWYLNYGLAKRDMHNWWLAGFLEVLGRHREVLRTEEHLSHLLAVLSLLSDGEHQHAHVDLCTQLVSSTFSGLGMGERQRVMMERCADDHWSGFLPYTHFLHSLTVTFNKLSNSASYQALCDVLPLALHDLLTFTHHAVSTAITSEGQLPVIVKVLGLIPAVMRSSKSHQTPSTSTPTPTPNSAPVSVLCGCLHSVLHSRQLSTKEHNNCLRLVSSLLQPVESTDPSHNALPMLSVSEFLSSCVFPYITLHQPDDSPPPISIEFALRLLIGCLQTTLTVGFSDWLKEVPVAVVVGCCGDVLQVCGVLVAEDSEGVESALRLKALALEAVGGMAQHLTVCPQALTEVDVQWLQDRCGRYDWSVCVTLAPFLADPDQHVASNLVEEYVRAAVTSVTQDAGAVLLVCAISDVALSHLSHLLPSHLNLSHSSLTLALAQVLPGLLVGQGRRVAQALSLLVDRDPHHLPIITTPHPHLSGGSGSGSEVVYTLLVEAVLVLVCQEGAVSDTLLHHTALVLVPALQWLMEQGKAGTQTSEQTSLRVTMFQQLCVLMSATPPIMVDPLFVLLLDLLTSIAPQQQKQEQDDKLCDLLECGISLVPDPSLRDTLHKKLYSQSV